MKTILYDVLRLFIGPWSASPRGIDRIDLAFAQHLFDEAPGEVIGVMATPWGVRLYDRRLVQRGLARLQDIWQESGIAAHEDPVLGRIKAQLAGRPAPAADRPVRSSPWHRQARMLGATSVPLGRAVRHAPRGALYLNVGQLGWAAPLAMGWLQRRSDVAIVAMLHDAIPLAQPELVSRIGNWSHHRMMRVAARRLDGLITTTRAASAQVRRELDARGGRIGAEITLPLPLAKGFLAADAPDADLAAQRYFVICGVIEPRKNHQLLMRLWPKMRDATLVVVGAPTRGAEAILASLQATRGVILAHGLSTPSLRLLLRHAQALLMPSLAEGYGLPVQEALSLGVPVIASDIAAHREIAQGQARLLPPDADPAWLDALRSELVRPAGYQAMSEQTYFGRIDEFLATL